GLAADGAEELWIQSGVCSALVSPRHGGVIEEYTVFEQGINYADVLTRRREPYHEPPSAQPGHPEANHTTDGTLSIHDIEAAARRVVRLRVAGRSEEHTSELQSRGHLVCRLLLEKKNTNLMNALFHNTCHLNI